MHARTMETSLEQCSEDIESGHQECPREGDSDESVSFSDAEEQSLHSPNNSQCPPSSHDVIEMVPEPCGRSFDLESGVLEVKCDSLPSKNAVEKDCRICHLSLVSTAAESGVAMELGCSCKGDLATVHRQCAETWFKIRGNKICEICGSIARNVAGATTTETETVEHWNEATHATAIVPPQTETFRFWQGHRFLNFLLACMVFAFVISWLFHFNVPG